MLAQLVGKEDLIRQILKARTHEDPVLPPDMQRATAEAKANAVGKHDAYMRQMIRTINPDNEYLHKHWESMMRNCLYCGDDLTSLYSDGTEYMMAIMMRQPLVEKYAFAIPHEPSLDILRICAPILEIGSGTGYWASLMKKKGIDVIAIDHCGTEPEWFPETIKEDGVKYLKNHGGCKESTLFLCWPHAMLHFVEAFKGDHFIWIGVENDDITGYLPSNDITWKLVERVEIPTFPTFRDVLHVYERLTLISDTDRQTRIKTKLKSRQDMSMQHCAYRDCEQKSQNLSRCSRCKRVFYCSKACQKKHWADHKGSCKAPVILDAMNKLEIDN